MLGIWFPIMAFVAMGFEHSVANMFFVPNGMIHGADVSVGEFLGKNLIPVTLGNLIGAEFFVGFLYSYLYAWPVKKVELPTQAAAIPPKDVES